MRFPLRAFLLALPLTIAVAGLANAQDASAPSDTTAPGDSSQARHHGDPAQQLARLIRRLQLTADQAAKIGPILQDRVRQAAALRNDSSVAGPDRRAKLLEIAQSHDSQIEALLSDSQRQQFIQLRQRAQQRRQPSPQATDSE